MEGDEATAATPVPPPAWMAECSCVDKSKSVIPPFKEVLIGINSAGVYTRPLPISHNHLKGWCRHAHLLVQAPSIQRDASFCVLSLPVCPSEVLRAKKEGRSALDRRFGASVPWFTHSVQFIEVWGVKKQRPVFTYRVREGRTLTLVELKSPQVRASASRAVCCPSVASFAFRN